MGKHEGWGDSESVEERAATAVQGRALGAIVLAGAVSAGAVFHWLPPVGGRFVGLSEAALMGWWALFGLASWALGVAAVEVSFADAPPRGAWPLRVLGSLGFLLAHMAGFAAVFAVCLASLRAPSVFALFLPPVALLASPWLAAVPYALWHRSGHAGISLVRLFLCAVAQTAIQSMVFVGLAAVCSQFGPDRVPCSVATFVASAGMGWTFVTLASRALRPSR